LERIYPRLDEVYPIKFRPGLHHQYVPGMRWHHL
jgi:hypothetical protein